MKTISDFYAALKAPFSKNDVQWRLGAMTKDKKRGQVLAYIDARTVFDRLDDVCGFGWQCNYSHASSKDTKTICNLGLFVPVGPPETNLSEAEFTWVWRADGAGDTDYEGEKGAISDALKRAAVRFGVGRYLYNLPAPWVSVLEKGSTHVIDPNEIPKLESELSKFDVNHTPKTSIVSDNVAIDIAIKAMKSLPKENDVILFGQENAEMIKKLNAAQRDKFKKAYVSIVNEKKTAEAQSSAN